MLINTYNLHQSFNYSFNNDLIANKIAMNKTKTAKIHKLPL